MASRTREERIIAAVECLRCGVAEGVPCKMDLRSLAKAGDRTIVHGERRVAWQALSPELGGPGREPLATAESVAANRARRLKVRLERLSQMVEQMKGVAPQDTKSLLSAVADIEGCLASIKLMLGAKW